MQRGRIEFFRGPSKDIMSLPILAERRPRNEGDAVLLAVVEEVIPLAVSKAIAVLHRDDRDDFAGALEVFEGHVGERDVADLALLRAVLRGFPSRRRRRRPDRGCGAGRRRCGRAKTLQTALHGFFKMFGAGVVDPLAGADALPSALGGDDEAFRVWVRGLRRSALPRRWGRRSRPYR